MRAKLFSIGASLGALLVFLSALQANAQAQIVGNNILTLPSQNPVLQQVQQQPVEQPKLRKPLISQVAPNLPAADAETTTNSSSSSMELDLAPVKLPERTDALSHFKGMQTSLLYKLPARMFFNLSVENSLRMELNVFQSSGVYKQDMIYRVLPNITAGYALTKKTRVSLNYFFLRDQYTRYSGELSRNIQSVGPRIDHDFQLTPRTTLTTSMFARELFITRSVAFTDLLPSITAVRHTGSRGVLYGSVIGQLRFRDMLATWQEGDQFYSFGGVYRLPMWTFSVDNTFLTNFGKRAYRQGPNNQMDIITIEIDRKVHRKLPVTAFVRAQPIFNIGANEAIGYAGFNFRIFGGLRIDASKAPIFPIKLQGG